MIVVQMLRVRGPADRAEAALLGEQLLELLLAHAVPPAQVVLPKPAVQPELALLALFVVARLAVAAAAVRPTAVRTELIERLPLTAVSATTASVSIVHGSRHVPSAVICPIHPLSERSP
jgi:hypothetical protein